MSKRVFLVTGTPCVGKTAIAEHLSSKLDGLYVNLTELAMKENLILRQDKKRNSGIINENKMRHMLDKIIDESEKAAIIIDGHYAAAVTPRDKVTRILVLRRDPRELRVFMERNGFPEPKLSENLAAEILDVCLVEALREHGKEKVCEMDVTGKTIDQSVIDALAMLHSHKKCRVGCVDWIGTLEKEGVLDDYLKI
jgi:adenylate kinase